MRGATAGVVCVPARSIVGERLPVAGLPATRGIYRPGGTVPRGAVTALWQRGNGRDECVTIAGDRALSTHQMAAGRLRTRR